MAKNNYLSEKQKDSLQKIPLELNYTPQSHRRGLATYFRSYLRGFMKNWTNNNFKKDGSSYMILIKNKSRKYLAYEILPSNFYNLFH